MKNCTESFMVEETQHLRKCDHRELYISIVFISSLDAIITIVKERMLFLKQMEFSMNLRDMQRLIISCTISYPGFAKYNFTQAFVEFFDIIYQLTIVYRYFVQLSKMLCIYIKHKISNNQSKKKLIQKRIRSLSCLNRQQWIISHLQSLLGCLNDSILITKKERKGKKREQQDSELKFIPLLFGKPFCVRIQQTKN